MSEESQGPLEVTLTADQLTMLDKFRKTEGLASRTAALKLLVEIAFEAVTTAGDRFWDKTATPGNEPPRR